MIHHVQVLSTTNYLALKAFNTVDSVFPPVEHPFPARARRASQRPLTAFVLTVLWGTVKKYGALRGRVAYRLKEQKRSRCFERTLLIKNFKYGSSLSIFVQKNKEAQRSQVSHF